MAKCVIYDYVSLFWAKKYEIIRQLQTSLGLFHNWFKITYFNIWELLLKLRLNYFYIECLIAIEMQDLALSGEDKYILRLII